MLRRLCVISLPDVLVAQTKTYNSSSAAVKLSSNLDDVTGPLGETNDLSENPLGDLMVPDASNGQFIDPRPKAVSLKSFCGILKRTGIELTVGNHFKPNPLLRNQLTLANQDEILVSTMTPLVALSYENQLRFKYERNKRLIYNLSKKIARAIPGIYLDNQNLICPLDPVIPSPVLSQVRNKDEMNVAASIDGYPKRVGFFIGRSSDNNIICVPPRSLINLKDSHKLLAKKFEEYISTSYYDACTVTTKGVSGHWKGITARSNQKGDLMAIVTMHPQDLSAEQLDQEKNGLREFFLNGAGSVCNLKSLFFQACAHSRCTALQSPYQLLFGASYLTEQCGHMKFQISPSAFFQGNVPAAELLYNKIGEFLKPDPSAVLLDICCGTGTIGLFHASKFEKVIGVERELLAIGDATRNAELNGIVNATFYCGNAEKLIPRILRDRSYLYSSVSAVVNPSRAGLPIDVIKALRMTSQLDRVVYVSCQPVGNAMRNMLDLCLPTSKDLPGEPFYPTRAVAVDMFPHTDQSELVILFERNRLFFI